MEGSCGEEVVVKQATECPTGCCGGNEILCVSIPCPITIVLLGITLTLNLPCLSLSSADGVGGTEVAPLVNALSSLLANLGTTLAGK
jgi:hypothetical protein